MERAEHNSSEADNSSKDEKGRAGSITDSQTASNSDGTSARENKAANTSSANNNASGKAWRYIRWPLEYFPTRFLIFGGLFAYVFLNFYTQFKSIEQTLLLGMFQFFRIPSFVLDGKLLLGSFHLPVELTPVLHSQVLFLIFFFALLTSARITMKMRLRILEFAGAAFGVFVVLQFAVATAMFASGTLSDAAVLKANTVLTGIAGSLMIELCLFRIMTLPPKIKIKAMRKRTFLSEYLYMALLLSLSVVVYLVLMSFLEITTDSPTTAFASASFALVFSFVYYITSVIYETRKPKWLKDPRIENAPSRSSKDEKSRSGEVVHDKADSMFLPLVSFIVPIYNEQATIGRCIKTIERAAAKYRGNTELILVNDGSTDDSEAVAKESISTLKYCSARLYTIKNSGKGRALMYGLERASGEIIFRLDGDSIIDENAIAPVVKHFRDPDVGSVSGMLWPIEEKTVWQRLNILMGCLYLYYKRTQESLDSILCQPGAYSVFRKQALIDVGGWSSDQNGEDGDLTIRLGRYGYKNEFEEHSTVHSESPESLAQIRIQRIRWCVGYYHTKARNMEVLKENNGPRSILILINMISHGLGFATLLFFPYLLASIAAGQVAPSINEFSGLIGLTLKITVIVAVALALKFTVFTYFLAKYKKLSYLKYMPVLKLYFVLIQLFFKPEAMEILLNWSSRWHEHTPKTYGKLRKDLLKGVFRH